MKLAKRLDGIGEYYFSQKLREIEGLNKQRKEYHPLSIGGPDLPPHPDVIRVLQEEAAKPNVHAYQSYNTGFDELGKLFCRPEKSVRGTKSEKHSFPEAF